MPMVYEDDIDAEELMSDYLQIEDFETGLGRFPLWAKRRGARHVFPRRRRRFGIPPGLRRKVYRPVTRPGAHTRTVSPPWFRRRSRGVPVPDPVRARLAAQRARWARHFQKQKIAKCKNLLARKGMLSDYLQVEGADLDPELGQLDIFKKILTAVGLRDPITHYEPGKSLSEVYAKYKAMVADMDRRIGLLRSDKMKKPLRAKIAPIKSLLTSLSRAFEGGATPGSRDRNRLAEVVQASRSLKRDLRVAEKTAGTAAPTITPEDPTPEPPADVAVTPTVTAAEPEIPAWVYYAGGGVALLLGLKFAKVI